LETQKETDTTFIYLLLQYNSAVIIVLFVLIVVNLLPCLIFKLNFIIGLYVWEKRTRQSSILSMVSGIPAGLGSYPQRLGETTV
jgi:hypothetical protein